jgi:hypothetical protein
LIRIDIGLSATVELSPKRQQTCPLWILNALSETHRQFQSMRNIYWTLPYQFSQLPTGARSVLSFDDRELLPASSINRKLGGELLGNWEASCSQLFPLVVIRFAALIGHLRKLFFRVFLLSFFHGLGI